MGPHDHQGVRAGGGGPNHLAEENWRETKEEGLIRTWIGGEEANDGEVCSCILLSLRGCST